MEFNTPRTSEEDIPPHRSIELLYLLSKLTIHERAKRFFDFWNFAREMEWTGLKMRNPGLSDKEVSDLFKQLARERFIASRLHGQ